MGCSKIDGAPADNLPTRSQPHKAHFGLRWSGAGMGRAAPANVAAPHQMMGTHGCSKIGGRCPPPLLMTLHKENLKIPKVAVSGHLLQFCCTHGYWSDIRIAVSIRMFIGGFSTKCFSPPDDILKNFKIEKFPAKSVVK